MTTTRTTKITVGMAQMHAARDEDMVRLIEMVGADPTIVVEDLPDLYARRFILTGHGANDEAVKVLGSALAALARGELARYFRLIDGAS